MFNSGQQLAKRVIHLWTKDNLPVDRIAAGMGITIEQTVLILETYLDGHPPAGLPALTR